MRETRNPSKTPLMLKPIKAKFNSLRLLSLWEFSLILSPIFWAYGG